MPSKQGDEIERKFLVKSDAWRAGAQGVRFRQGYLNPDPDRTVRVRLEGEIGKLTVKGRDVNGKAPEFEYDIPRADAARILEELCLKPLIDKTRYRVEHQGHTWEVDEFHGANEGLVVAELELEREDETFAVPAWAGQEVTKDYRYKNVNLAKHPYSEWGNRAG